MSKTGQLSIISGGKGKGRVDIVYDHDNREWFIHPPMCHPLIPVASHVRMLRYGKGTGGRMAWSWDDLKAKCADAIGTSNVEAIEHKLAELAPRMTRED